jgi:hypothetical protein
MPRQPAVPGRHALAEGSGDTEISSGLNNIEDIPFLEGDGTTQIISYSSL